MLPTCLRAILIRVPLRAIIVDDNPAFIDVASELLEEQGLTVVGTATTYVEAARLVEELRPDVVLVDVELGAESGFTVAQKLTGAAAAPPSKVILISTHSAVDYRELIDESPAIGFIPKHDLSASIVENVLARAS
jgi:two-component system, NarL family, nitrate/nitrite response regulator NarL